VAISDDYGFLAERTSPKPFTEYSFSAIMVLVAQVGSCFCAISQFSVVLFFAAIPLFFLAFLAWIIFGLTLIVLPVSIYQTSLGYKLHKEGLQDNNRIMNCNVLIIIIEIISLLVITINILLLILLFQVYVAVLIFNFISFFLMKSEDVQKEFRRAKSVG
jgi:hypothetical protein